jgi:tetratricopeptide (TPR) repeat protein
VLVNVIFDETEGNPFFVEEVFRHLVEEGKVFDENGEFRTDVHVGELEVPESVRLVVGRRLERLGPQALKVLAAAAVVGRGFQFALLEEIGGVEAGELLDVVDEAEAAKVIVPEEIGGEAHYTFAHELIRQTLLGTISLPRRQRLHLAVADAIEKIDPDAADMRPSELANHLLQAGVAADAQRTIDLLERTADRAYEGAAFEEAARAVDAALQLVSPDDVQRLTRLKDRLGWALRALGRFDECIAIWDEVVETYRALGENERAADLCREMGYQLLWLGRFEDSFASNQRGLDIIGEQRISTRARLLSFLGSVLGFGGFSEAAAPYFQEAEEIARGKGDDVALGEVFWPRSAAAFVHLRLREAVDAGRAAVAHLERANSLWSLCDAYGWLSLALHFSGSPQEAIAVANEGNELAVRLGHVGAQILLGRGGSIGPTTRGDLDSYERFARHDLELCESIRSPWIAQSYTWMAMVAEHRGRIDEALAWHDRAVPLEPASAFTGFTLGSRLINRAYASAVGEFRDRLAEAEEAITGRTEPLQIGAGSVWVYGAMGAAVLGLGEEADRLYPYVAARAEEAWVLSFGCHLSQRVAGMAAAAAERWDEAESHFVRALEQIQKTPHRLDEPQVKHWYGKMLIDSGRDRARARDLLAGAVDDYIRIGMPMHAAMAEQLLR